MNWAFLIRKGLSQPLDVAAIKAGRLALRQWRSRKIRLRDRRASTYGHRDPGPLHDFVPGPPLDMLAPMSSTIAELAEYWVAHRFDVLGSGWQSADYGAPPPGLEGHRYLPSEPVSADARGDWIAAHVNRANVQGAQRRWTLIVGPYRPIDWQRDMRSGYRWSARTWYRDITRGHLPGVDVKSPRELARLQHLPTLAYAWRLAASGHPGFWEAKVYASEWRNHYQIRRKLQSTGLKM